MKVRFQADADLNQTLILALVRREPRVDFQTAFIAGLVGLDDTTVLALAAHDGRVLVTHDQSTMAQHFSRFITAHLKDTAKLTRPLRGWKTVLLKLHEELRSKSYQPGAYCTFEIAEPKRHMISVAPYHDRVVGLCTCFAPRERFKLIYWLLTACASPHRFDAA